LRAGSANHGEDGNPGSGEKNPPSHAHRTVNVSVSFPLAWLLSHGREGVGPPASQSSNPGQPLALPRGLCSEKPPPRGRSPLLPSRRADPCADIPAMAKWADCGQGMGRGPGLGGNVPFCMA